MLLKSIQTTSGQFCLLQLDQVFELSRLLQLQLEPPQFDGSLSSDGQDHNQPLATSEQLGDFYNMVMSILSQEASGAIVSPEYNFGSILHKDNQAGLLLSLEKQQASPDYSVLPPLIPNWGVEHTRNNYALAKLELWYHPHEPQAIPKKQLVAEIYDYCQMLGIDFLLELKIYPYQQTHQEQGSQGVQAPASQESELQAPDSQASGLQASQPLASKPQAPETKASATPAPALDMLSAQVMAIEDFRNQCDLIALEFPGDTLNTITVSAQLDIPWILTEGVIAKAGPQKQNLVSYEQFKENLRVALEGGASGFMAGNLIWRDIFAKISQENTTDNLSQSATKLEKCQQLLPTIIRDRMIELVRITNEAGKQNLVQNTRADLKTNLKTDN